MKTKNKIMIAASCLLLLSGAAAGTSTFAWYTANRNANLSITDIGVKTQTTGLDISLNTEKTDADITDDQMVETYDVNLKTSLALTDVTSADGKIVEKPIFDATGTGNPENVIGWWEKDTETTGWDAKYPSIKWSHKFTLTFRATGTEKVAIYISPTSKFTDAAHNASTSGTGVRGAAYVDGEEKGIYLNPNDGDNTYWKKDSEPLATPDTVSAEPDGQVKAILDKNGLFARSSNYVESDLNTTTYTDLGNGYLFELQPSEGMPATKDVTFYLWNEGSDANTMMNTNGNQFITNFTASLGFYSLMVANIPAA